MALSVSCNHPTLVSNGASESELRQLVRSYRILIGNPSQCDIPEHRQQIVSLGRRLNGQLPISRLPAELLAQILVYYIHAFREEEIHARYRTGDTKFELIDVQLRWPRNAPAPPSPNPEEVYDIKPSWRWWLILTRVCHYWRTLVLSTPALWFRVNKYICEDPELLEKFLMRSRGAFLDVDLEWCSTRDFPVGERLKRILLDPSCIRFLALSVGVPILNEVFSDEGSRYMAQIQDIVLTDFSPSASPGFNIAPIIRHVDTPTLRTFKLTGFAIQWDCLTNLPSSITHLHMRYNCSNCPHSGTQGDIVSLLRKLSHLQNLEIECTLPGALPIGQSHDPIHLSHLKELRLRDPSYSLVYLFQSLIFPSTTQMHLSMRLPEVIGSDLDQMSALFASALSRIPHQCRLGVGSVIISLDSSFKFTGQKLVALRAREFRGCYDDRFRFGLWGGPEESVHLAWNTFVEACNSLELSSVTSLQITTKFRGNAYWQPCAADYVEILKAAPDVTFLMIEGSIDVGTALSIVQPDGTVLVPKLERLEMRDTGFKENIGDREHAVNIDQFCAALEARRDLGHPIPTLSIVWERRLNVKIGDNARRRLTSAVLQFDEIVDMHREK